MIYQIAKYISDNVSGLTLGTNLETGGLRDSPQEAVFLLEPPSGTPDDELQDVRLEYLQVYSRSKSYKTARDNSIKVFDFLHTKSGIELAAYHTGEPVLILNYARATSRPAHLGVNKSNGLNAFSTIFLLHVQEK